MVDLVKNFDEIKIDIHIYYIFSELFIQSLFKNREVGGG